MQINLGTSLSGLRQAIATSSVPNDYTETNPDSFTGADGQIVTKDFLFNDIPFGYLESITVTFTVSGETDSSSPGMAMQAACAACSRVSVGLTDNTWSSIRSSIIPWPFYM